MPEIQPIPNGETITNVTTKLRKKKKGLFKEEQGEINDRVETEGLELKKRSIDFEGKVVIVTGAGRGIGRSIAIMYARRGASVVVNDVGCDLGGSGANREKAEDVVRKIHAFGGEAVACYSSVLNSDVIAKFAVEKYGRIDILICNAGVLVDTDFSSTSVLDWAHVMNVHFHSTCSLIRDCWKTFSEQGYGKIVISATDEAILQPTLNVPYCTSKTALLGLTSAIASEGQELGIFCNAFSPAALTRMNQEDYAHLHKKEQYSMHPKRISPLVAYLSHEKCNENGGFFKVGLGQHFKFDLNAIKRFKLPDSMSPDSIISLIAKKNSADDSFFGNILGPDLIMAGQVVIVSGADTGVGQLIARQLVETGASVIIRQEAPTEIERLRNKRMLLRVSQRFSNRVSTMAALQGRGSLGVVSFVGDAPCADTVASAVREFGKVDVLIHCSSSPGISDEWHCLAKQQMDTAYLLAKEAWPFFKAQNFGRIVHVAPMGRPTPSFEPIKMGLIGMSASLTAEGQSHNIIANTLTGRYERSKNEAQLAVSVACLLAHKNNPYKGVTLDVRGSEVRQLGLSLSSGLDLGSRIPTWDYPEAIYHNFASMSYFDHDELEELSIDNLVDGNGKNSSSKANYL